MLRGTKQTTKNMKSFELPLVIAALLFVFSNRINSQTVTDYDGNTYPVVTIGTQVWMGENLKSVHSSDGTEIAYTWKYNDSDSLADIYGMLYNWESVMHGQASSNNVPSGVMGICPNGWHLPSLAEWNLLIDYCGGVLEAGGKLKEADTTHWYPPNEGANNSTGFTALPGGSHGQNGYSIIGESGFWWTSFNDNGFINIMALGKDVPYAITFGSRFQPQELNETGYSVRCLKNSGATPIPVINESEQFSIYPDPTNEWIKIIMENNESVDLSIYGLDGKLMLQEQLNQRETVIDLRNFSEGTYIVSLKFSKGIIQRKIIKISNKL
jgi:uncharacterized protein (TIGR02145 family)